MLVWLPVLIYNLELRMGTGHGHGCLGHGNRMPTAHLAPNGSKSSRKQSRLYRYTLRLASLLCSLLALWLTPFLVGCSFAAIFRYTIKVGASVSSVASSASLAFFLSFPFISLLFGWNIFNALDILGTEQYFLMHLQFFC